MGTYVNPNPSLEDLEEQEKIQRKIEYADDYTPKSSVYFAFIDVLGFKKTFDDNRYQEKNDFADKYRDVFNYYFELMTSAKFMNNDSGCYAGQTSDSLYFYTDRIDMLVEFIKLFARFNLYAMEKDVFFRGGIAKGGLFSKAKHQFYGDSVIFAYLLESVVAKYPVIFIDQNTYEDLKVFKQIQNLIENQNQRHYIKPFSLLLKDMPLDLNFPDIVREIDEQRIWKNINTNKKMFEFDVKNYEKYVFLCKEYERTKNI